MSESLYLEQIMDHYKNPRNFGCLEKYTFKHAENNPLCGDEIQIEVELNSNKVSEIRFSGKGCAISQASASMLTEFVKEKTIDEIKKLTRDNVVKMLGIKIGAVRIKCAVLALVALKNGIKNFEEK